LQHLSSDYNRAYDPDSSSNMIQAVTAPISKATQRTTMATAATAAFFPLPLAFLARSFPSDLYQAMQSFPQHSATHKLVVLVSIYLS
jgi:hypothetical protein